MLLAMGADLTILNERVSGGEKMGDIVVRSASLHGTTVAGDLIPRLVDEIPVLAVAAACASGVTEIHDAQELKVKESNRLETVAQGLQAFGVEITVLEDGLAHCRWQASTSWCNLQQLCRPSHCHGYDYCSLGGGRCGGN